MFRLWGVARGCKKLPVLQPDPQCCRRGWAVNTCDTIFLMEKGRLVAQGRYDALVAENEIFWRMAAGV